MSKSPIEVIQQVLGMARVDLEYASSEFKQAQAELERLRKRVAERQDRYDALESALETLDEAAK